MGLNLGFQSQFLAHFSFIIQEHSYCEGVSCMLRSDPNFYKWHFLWL